jgi:hypothetical protein
MIGGSHNSLDTNLAQSLLEARGREIEESSFTGSRRSPVLTIQLL